MMILVVVGIGLLAYYLFKDGTTSGRLTYSNNQSAEERLKARFVNGEIDDKTYQQMKATING